ncbi:arginase [Aliikangiella sp. IMCC44359]|uniref:arginase n=1 Tax=Aliikangiella sp. IMCC44359 TaxID=3459125 RepID=UPI00403AD26B
MQPKSVITGYACGQGARNNRTRLGPKECQNFFSKQPEKESFCWGKIIEHDDIHINSTGLEAMNVVSDCCTLLSQEVSSIISNKEFPIVIGGDHSSAVGTWSGVACATRQVGNMGLLYIDAHMDSHTFESTHSGYIHGMPIAALLGHGYSALTKIGDANPKIQPEHICMLGIRDYEPEERALLEKLGSKIFYMEEIEQRGFSIVFQEALAHLRAQCDLFGMSIDIDGLCPKDAPGTGYHIANGIKAKDLLNNIKHLKQDPQFCALEIAEFNPENDVQERTLNIIKNIILAIE